MQSLIKIDLERNYIQIFFLKIQLYIFKDYKAQLPEERILYLLKKGIL